MKFEDKVSKRSNRRLLIECIKARERETSSKEWMGKREDFSRQNGFSSEGNKNIISIPNLRKE